MRTSTNWEYPTAQILVIDDNEHNLKLANQVLQFAGYTQVKTLQDPRKAVEAIVCETPDLVLLDVHMPYMDGYEILEQVNKRSNPDTFVPILMCTSDNSLEARQRALKLGANDFITKPFERTEMLLRVRNFLRMRYMHLSIYDENGALETRGRIRTQEVLEARSEALECLARALEYRDDATGGHTKRVGNMSGKIAETLGLPPADVEMIRLTAPLHDLGKIGVSDEILLKPGKYTPEEFEAMRRHTLLGETIIGDCRSPILKEVREIAVHHHEKWDGSGYPHGLKGEQIPIACRIVALADMFDALTHVRPYKQAWTHEDAAAEITRLRGTHFDPAVVDAFLKIYG
jgi:putative two-component system response regulator